MPTRLEPRFPLNSSIPPVSSQPAKAAAIDPIEAARSSAAAALASIEQEANTRKNSVWPLILIAAALMIALIVGASFFQRRSQAKDAAVASSSIPKPAEGPAPAPKPDPQHVKIEVLQPTWAEIIIDGHGNFQGILHPESAREFDYSERAVLRVADGSNVDLILNASRVPVAPGPQSLELTRAGAAFRKNVD